MYFRTASSAALTSPLLGPSVNDGLDVLPVMAGMEVALAPALGTLPVSFGRTWGSYQADRNVEYIY